MGKVVLVVGYLGTVRGKPMGVRDFLQGGGSGSASLWIGYMGDEPLYGLGPGGFPSQGGQDNHSDKSLVASGWNLGVTYIGGGGMVGGVGVGGRCGDINIEESEYSYAVYCNANDSVHM